MSHEIETFAYSGQPAWHGLGVEVPDNISTSEMLQIAGLDWTVSKQPTFVQLGKVVKQTGSFALVRDTDSRILTPNISKDWMPVQNEQAFDFFSEFVNSGQMSMHTAGSLRNGQIVFALAKVNESFEAVKGDLVESYLLFTNPHIFGRAIDVRFTPIRVVCNNTLTFALNSNVERMVRVNHRMQFDPEVVKETLGIATEKFSAYKEMSQFLAKKKVTKKQLEEYFTTVFPPVYTRKDGTKMDELSKNATTALELFRDQPGAEFAGGSFWNAYNTVTYMADHIIGKSADSRLYSSWYGTNQQRKLNALNLAVEMAK